MNSYEHQDKLLLEERKAKYLLTALLDLHRKAQEVMDRLYNDLTYTQNVRKRVQRVYVPRTDYTRGAIVEVLNGDFDRAVNLVKEMGKLTGQPFPHPSGVKRREAEKRRAARRRPRTESLGDLLRDKLDSIRRERARIVREELDQAQPRRVRRALT